MTIELQCRRCYQSVSFADVAPGATLFCPVCKEPMTLPERTPTAPATAVAPAANAAPWWVGDAPAPAPASPNKPAGETVVVRTAPSPPREDSAPSMSTPALTPYWSAAALILGVLAFGLVWLPRLPWIALLLGGLGLLFAAVRMGQAAIQRRDGKGFALAAAMVNLQAIVLTLWFLLASANKESSSLTSTPTTEPNPVIGDPSPPPPDRPPTLADLAVLLRHDKLSGALRHSEPEGRRANVAAVGEVGRHLFDAVGDLADQLNDNDAGVRAAAAEALGKLGPPAKGAYPRLLHASKNDPDLDVRRAAQGALERLGELRAGDALLLARCLKEDANANFRASLAQTLLMIGVIPDEVQPALKDALNDSDVRVRVFSAQTLWLNLKNDRRDDRSVREVVEVLRAALRDSKDPAVQAAAAFGLGSIGKPARDSVRELREMLARDGDSEARLRAAEALYSIADDTATVVPELRKLLSDKQPSVRGLAAEALGRIGRRAAAAVADLRDLLRKDEPRVRASAAFALGGIGPDAREAVPDLLAALSSARGNPREQIVAALGAIGPDAAAATPALIELLQGESANLRARAAFALGAIGRPARKAVAPLSALLKSSRDPGERLILAQALWRIDRDAEQTVPVFLDLLQQSDSRLRLAALGVLDDLGASARLAVPALLEMQKNAAEEMRHAIESALETIGPLGKDDVPDLIKALSSSSSAYRLAAAQTLMLLGADAADAVPGLTAALTVNDAAFRLAIVRTLGAIGPPAAPAIPKLTALLAEGSTELQMAVAETLGVLGDKAAASVPALMELLSAKDVEVRKAGVEALGAMGCSAVKAVPAIIHLLESDESTLRAGAAFALGNLGHEPSAGAKAERQALRDALKNAVAPLKDAAVNDKDSSVRLYAGQALHVLGAPNPLVVGVLKKCLMDRDDAGVRAAAAEALGEIGPKCRDADKEVVPLLVQVWKTDRDEVRRAAFEALKRIAPNEVQAGRR